MIEPQLDEPERERPLIVRLGWMALYWAMSVLALGLVALVIRTWIGL